MTAELTAAEVLENVVPLLENQIADLALKLDDIGWNPLGVELEQKEIPLDTIKEVSDKTRALVAINPLVKHGVGVRTDYIWGKGIEFKGLEDDDEILKHPLNKKFLFSAEAQAELEKCLATDGNFFFLARKNVIKPRGRRTKVEAAPKVNTTGMRVPVYQITGIVTNPENPEDIWFYKRQWTETRYLKTEDRVKSEDKIEYYPSDLYDTANGEPARIGGKKVNWDSAIIEHSVNKQVGWRFGLPDAMAVIFWAKAHKEFLEDSAKLVKAYSRYAFKATAPTPMGVKNVAAKVAAQPPMGADGKPMDIGATAVLSQGANLQAVGRTAGSVDFSAGIPLAGYVAAGLEIPLTDLLSDSSLSNRSSSETLAESKLAAMVKRQKSWVAFFERLFAFWGKEGVEPKFPRIEVDPTYRRVQSVMLAKDSMVLSAQEIRDLLVAAFDLHTDDELPTEEQLGLLILEMQKAAEAKERADAAKAAQAQNSNSYGDNTNRDEVGAHEYDPTDGKGS